MRSAKKSDDSTCYEYILIYTDDIVINENSECILQNQIRLYFEQKESSIDPLKIYLGGKFCKVKPDNGINTWDFSSS